VLDLTVVAGGEAHGAVVGREPELARAEAFLASAAHGSAVMLVEGEAGIGKTTVWQEVAERADALGFRVLAARPAAVETKLALTAVADLLELVPSEAFAALPEPQRRALDIALLRVEPSGGALEPVTVATAVRSLLGELSREQPLIVAIDDAHWLDPTSATVLAFALRRLRDQPVGWLGARRPGSPVALPVETLVAPETLTRITLGPLTLGALHHVVKGRLERALSRAALVRVHEASGGNPFYALEIARAIDPRAPAEPVTRLPVPDHLRELVAARIPMLDPEVREALLAAAALSQPTADLVERAASADGLVAAEETGLVSVDALGRITFSHPLYASAIYDAAATGRRRRLHRLLADLVADREERARHLAFAASGPDAQVAEALEDAAVLARARGAWVSAADLLQHARGLTPPSAAGEAARRALAAAEHQVHAGDRGRARALIEEVMDEPLARPLRADALRLLAEIAISDDNVSEASRLCREGLEHAADPRVAGVIELLSCYACTHEMDFARGRTHAYHALEHARAAGDRSLEGQALAHCAMMDFFSGHGLDWAKLDRALQLEDRSALVSLLRRPSTRVACLLACLGRHLEGREALTSLCEEARERGDESDLAFALLWISWLETRAGRLATAAAYADEAVSLAALTGARSMRCWALAQRGYVHAHRGELAEARECCAEASSPKVHSGSALTTLWIAAALGLGELAAGDADAAWRAYEPVTARLERDGIGEPVPYFFLPDALETLIARGALDRAETLLDQFEPRAREVDRPWASATAARCRALLLAARGDLCGAAAAVDGARGAHQLLDMPIETGRTLLVCGAIERRARRRARAKDALERAAAIFDETGAQRWAAHARTELDRLGLRRAAGDELTEGERRVAELAARGMTNREVAAALFISPKTVDANLGRIYRKLGIASRAELGARMAAAVEE
jgi:DNA-binding CsgD family transcriptional regulator